MGSYGGTHGFPGGGGGMGCQGGPPTGPWGLASLGTHGPLWALGDPWALGPKPLGPGAHWPRILSGSTLVLLCFVMNPTKTI